MRMALSIALAAVLIPASSQANEAPIFHQLSTAGLRTASKPLAASPMEAPVKTVLTATLNPDGTVVTQCRTEHEYVINRQPSLEQKQ